MTQEDVIKEIEDVVINTLPIKKIYSPVYQYNPYFTTFTFKKKGFDFILKIIIYTPETEGAGVFVDIFINQFHTKTDIIYNHETLSEFKNFVKYMVN